MNKYLSFDNEVKFQVGQRVNVNLPEIPLSERETTTGIIVGTVVRFPTTPLHRNINYIIWFDDKGNYVKKDSRMCGGISSNFQCGADKLTLEKD